MSDYGPPQDQSRADSSTPQATPSATASCRVYPLCMSRPVIPGYLEQPSAGSLTDLWTQPTSVPAQLWPVETIRTVRNDPTDWVTVAEHHVTGTESSGSKCVLVQAGDTASALAGTDWIGSELGKVGVFDDESFEGGLAGTDRGLAVEFFAQVRRPSGATAPVPEISHPFLWYWDAFPARDGWKYLDGAGREQDLVRQEIQADRWKIELRALEFRQFLAACGRSSVFQVDHVTWADLEEFERVDDEFTGDWAHFCFYALHEPSPTGRPAFSRLLGRYIVRGVRNSRVPRFEEWNQDYDYPAFIYGTDRETGQPLSHTCDPEQLGTYFDKDGTRLHYLTPVYFKREVLQPYAAEPGKYALSATRLSCLDLWGADISFNSAGLVKVYLGDLGRDLPAAEWGHWKSYNVPPRGTMDEGRFRRDFLSQFASSKIPPVTCSAHGPGPQKVPEALAGSPIWRPLPADARAEFESLVGPLSDAPAALGQALLVLTKALVDGIDPAPLKTFLGSHEKDEKSLSLLGRFSDALGGPPELTLVFRQLQNFRSGGGVAHLAGSGRAKAAADLGVTGLSNWEAFESVVMRLTTSLTAFTELMVTRLSSPDSATDSSGTG